MHRRLFRESFPIESPPAWQCPRSSCKNGVLKIDAATAQKAQAKDSDLGIQGNGYHPELDWGRCAAILRCTVCGDAISLAGRFTYEVYATEDGHEYEQRLWPRYFEPPIPMIAIPPKCPAGVSEMLRESFALYWASPGSAANSIRISLERLLDDLGVVKEKPNKKLEMRPLTLHARIEEYREAHPGEVADYLEAAKWVGNAGSHQGGVPREAVLDVLEFVEHVLAELYPKDRSHLSAKAAAIIAAKGPA